MKHLKQEFDKLTFKEVIIYSLAVVTMLSGLTLLFAGLFIPPEGEIHGSVLTAFGSVCIFVASLLGISLHYANELDKFKNDVQQKLNEITQ
nr:MAG TPA: TMEM238 protein family protein [Caudoviricetes sp.]